MRMILAVAAWLLLATFAPPHLYRERPIPAEAFVYAEPLALFEGRPQGRKLGDLVYLGGWSIRSNHPGFGGISAMHVEGEEVLALSDAGAVIRFHIPTGQGGAPVQVQMLTEGPGPFPPKHNRDMESLAVAGDGAWVGFENRDAVWRYARSDWRARAGSAPPAMARWRANKGAEAMLRLPDGRFLIFSEGYPVAEGVSEVLLFGDDPAAGSTKITSLGYKGPKSYRITDAALLPDGRVLFVNRRVALSGFTAKLTVGTLPELKAGAILTGHEVAGLRPPAIADNMEAISVTQEGGRAIVWMASDDNFSPLQRTLLLKFEFAG